MREDFSQLPPREAVALLAFARRLGERARGAEQPTTRTAVASAITAYMESRAIGTQTPMMLTAKSLERAMHSFDAGAGQRVILAMSGGGGQIALFSQLKSGALRGPAYRGDGQ